MAHGAGASGDGAGASSTRHARCGDGAGAVPGCPGQADDPATQRRCVRGTGGWRGRGTPRCRWGCLVWEPTPRHTRSIFRSLGAWGFVGEPALPGRRYHRAVTSEVRRGEDTLRARLNWAARRLQELYLGLDEFQKSKPFTVRCRVDPRTSERVYTVHDLEPPPPDLAFMAGDVVHHLCSLLDNIAWALWERAADKRGIGEKTVSFPLSAKELKKAREGWLGRVDPRAEAAIERFQPIEGAEASSDVLRHLEGLWSGDKHRTPALSLVNQTAASYPYSGPGEIKSKVPRRRPLREGDWILRLQVPDGAQLIGDPIHELDLCYQDRPLTGVPLRILLGNGLGFVREEVVPAFAPLLGERP